ncbi:hypothetical protein BDR03DRAFT_107447 [Suillus americanus]|nr:hypothetical protein BDR03DRAFT_107447 [Suillus americanus]
MSMPHHDPATSCCTCTCPQHPPISLWCFIASTALPEPGSASNLHLAPSIHQSTPDRAFQCRFPTKPHLQHYPYVGLESLTTTASANPAHIFQHPRIVSPIPTITQPQQVPEPIIQPRRLVRMEVRTASRRRGGARTRVYRPRYLHRGAILLSNVPSGPLLLRGLVECTVWYITACFRYCERLHIFIPVPFFVLVFL